MKKSKILIAIALFLPMLFNGCVETQDFALLENRVTALETDNLNLKEKAENYENRAKSDFVNFEEGVGEAQKEQREKYAELNVAIKSLKQNIRILKGEIEESEYRLSKSGVIGSAVVDNSTVKRLDDAVSMNYRRLVKLEKHLGLKSGDFMNTAEKSTPDSAASPDINEEALYSAAKSFLDQGKNKEARKNFELFIEKFPTSSSADNARFWIADSYYRDKWYEKAILEYQRVLEEYPRGNKVTAALLKQGYSFAKLGEKGNARLILKDLIQKYPQSQEAKSARTKMNAL